jgi:excisionase family DNA binding protein
MTTSTSDDRPAYSPRTLAERWECSDSLVRKLIKEGKLTAFTFGNLVRIKAAEVDRYEGVSRPQQNPEPTKQESARPSPREDTPTPLTIVHSYSSKLPDWPGAMTRKTLATYLDMSEAAVEREVVAGRLPHGFMLGNRMHWSRADVDAALARIIGEDDPAREAEREFWARGGRGPRR